MLQAVKTHPVRRGDVLLLTWQADGKWRDISSCAGLNAAKPYGFSNTLPDRDSALA